MSDLCSACGQANRAGARYCAACGAALALRCSACGSDLAPGARFCDECGTPVSSPSRSREAARRTVSVVFSDLAGSTAMQETLDAESVRQIMARYYEVMRAVVARHQGSIEKFIGDAVVAVFGTPVVREDDALRAVRCAAAMVGDLAALNDELDRVWGTRLAMRTGVNTGELVVSSEGILVGDAMNTAARLEQAAAAGEVLLGEATWRLVRHHVIVEEVAPLELKGKAAPVRAWRLLSADAEAHGGELEDAPLVGRESELDRLRSALETVVEERGCRLVTVVGSPGLGKSRLAHEFTREVSGGARVLHGHCEPSAEGNAFLPVAEVIREVAGIGEAESVDTIREKLRALAVADDPDRERLIDRVAGVLGIAEPASVQETFWALRRGLEHLATDRPLVVVLDDVHWAQPMLLDLLEHLVEWIKNAPVLIVALARPELRETREVLTAVGRRAIDVIELEPLDSGESRALVDGLLGASELPTDLLKRMLETTEGNPLFLGELVRMLVDEGALVRSDGGWAVAAQAEAFDVPPTIHALLSARIERLRDAERAVVERAAVIGQQFYRGAVAELLAPPARAGIDDHLAALRRKELVEPEGVYWIDEPVYRFHHVLIRDAAYRLLLKEARAVLHERFADWLATKAGELVGEYEEVIAFHLEQAHSYRRELGPLDDAGRALGVRAATHLLSAGRRALTREDLAAAENLLTRAVACEGGLEAEILWDLAETVLTAGGADRAGEVVAQYRATAAHDRVGRARAAVIEGQLASLTADDDPLRTAATVEAAAAELHELGDGRGEAKAWAVLAQTNARLGRVAVVEMNLDRALTAARSVDDRRRTTAVLAAAPRAALWGPSTVVRASGRCLDVVRILRMTPGNRHVEALALRCQAVLEAMRGRPDAARDILAGARATLEELGLSLELNETWAHAAMVELLAGEPGRAVEALGGALAGFQSLGADAAAAHASALLARALVARGEPGDAEAALEAVAFAEQHGGEDLRTAIITLSARGEALSQTGQTEQAIAAARRAVELAEPTDALADKADASMAHARVLLAAGRRDEAVAAAQAAAGAYQAKGHTVGMEAAARVAGQASEAITAGPRAVGSGAERLGDRPSERLCAEFIRLCNERRFDELERLLTDDCYIIDHRALGWEEFRGPERCMVGIRSPLEASPHVQIDVDEVLACDDRVVVTRNAWRGRGITAGALEVRVGAVNISDGERWLGVEFYEPDDVEAMLARFAQLRGEAADVLGDRPSERVTAEFIRCYNERDFDAMARLVSDDCYWVDHRRMGWEEVRGREQYMAFVRSALPSPSLRYQVDEVIAADDRVVVGRCSWQGHGVKAGELELRVGTVTLTENGRLLGVESYEPDDVEAMLARFAELRSDLPAALVGTPFEQIYAAYLERFAARDVEGVLALYADDYVLRDHRPIATMEVAGKGDLRALFDTSLAMSADMRCTVEEVLACEDHIVALRLAYRGHANDGGGMVETAVGIVNVMQDGLITSSDQYEYEDDAGMLRCFTALGGERGRLGTTRSERVAREHIRRVASGDLDFVVAQFHENFEARDHRPTVSQEPIRGRAAVRSMFEGIFAMTESIRYEIDEVIAADDGVMAVRCAYRGRIAGGGDAEVLAGHVTTNRDELLYSVDSYDYDDTASMLARFSELGGQRKVESALTATERFFAEYHRLTLERDYDAIERMLTPDCTWVDHRAMAWEPARGRERVMAVMRSTFEAEPDVRADLEEILASDDHVIAARVSWHGPGRKAGAWRVEAGVVHVLRDGLWASTDFFDPEDRQAMIARYVELGGGISALGDRKSELILAEWCRRYARRDLERMMELIDPEFTWVDHRALSWEPFGREGLLAVTRSAWEEAADIRIEIDDVLAVDDRVIATRIRFVGRGRQAGAFELPVGQVCRYENGLGVSLDQYDYNDDEAMLARFAELTAAPLGPDAAMPQAERLARAIADAFNRHDADAVAAISAEDVEIRDHREMGWGDLRGRAAVREQNAAGMAVSHDVRMDIEEILAGDDRVIAWRSVWRGHFTEGGGEYELPAGWVMVFENGEQVSTDIYDPDDRQAMIARYTELGGGLSALGDSPLEQLWAEFCRRFARKDIDGLLELVSEDYTLIDHRPIGWETPRGHDGFATLQTTTWATLDVRIEVGEVLAVSDRAIAMVVGWVGHGGEEMGGGEFAAWMGRVTTVIDGRIVQVDQYEPEDRDAMLARFEELNRPQPVALGERPPERWHAEYARRWAEGDVDGLVALADEGWVLTDRRSVAVYGEIRGRQAARDTVASSFDGVRQPRFAVHEVLACDETTIAAVISWSGIGLAGAAFSNEMGTVAVIRDGLQVSVDLFEPEDREGMLERFQELRAQRS